MQIFVDADGCPVVENTIRIAGQYQIPVILVCDTSHEFNREGAKTITVSKGADSVDFALVNLIGAGDIVVTQDYGLAAMCLAKQAVPVSQNGMVYTAENIDGLLLARHTAKKIRNAGGRLKGNSKRTKEQDLEFEQAFVQLVEKMRKSGE